MVSDDDNDSGPDTPEPFTTESNYRTLMSEMMLSVRIENPTPLRNRTIGQHLAQIDWSNDEISRNVEVSFHRWDLHVGVVEQGSSCGRSSAGIIMWE